MRATAEKRTLTDLAFCVLIPKTPAGPVSGSFKVLPHRSMASPDLFFQVFALLFFLARNVLDGSSGRGFSRLLARLKRQRASLRVLMRTFFDR
jgi:hypothetical protein